jgi:uncharacterized protein (DUF427 family)
MSDRPILQPSPRHPITLERNPRRVVVKVGGTVIADTRDALTLREADYEPVEYVPLADVDPEQLLPSEHESYCPFKGEASYYSLPAGGDAGENAVWEYRRPHDAVAAIKDRVAFYRDRVEIEELT